MRATHRGTLALIAAAAALTLATALPARAQATAEGRPTVAMDGKWHFTVAPYFWFSGIKGDVSVKGLPSVPIEISFSEAMSNFHFGFLGAFEGRKDRWGFALDTFYLDLHVPVQGTIAGRSDLEATVKDLVTEGDVFYRVASGGRKDNPATLDLLVGARYYDTSAQLNATFPYQGVVAGEKRGLSWTDAVTGLRFRAPLGSRAAFLGRADVAFFGSKITWNLTGDLAVGLSERWTVGAGWRYLDIDYEKGSGATASVVNLAYSGPRIWGAYSW
jgi:hypothetical protein